MSGWKDNDAVTITYRTLRQAQAEAAAAEQERIINLIKPFTVCDDDCDHYGCTTFVAEQVIALIKGQK